MEALQLTDVQASLYPRGLKLPTGALVFVSIWELSPGKTQGLGIKNRFTPAARWTGG